MSELSPDYFNSPSPRSTPRSPRCCEASSSVSSDARDDRLGELRSPCGARMPGLGAHEQVRRGLPRPPLLRRLRVGGRLRAARDRSREGAIRRRARERPAALRSAGEHRRLPRAARAGRDDHGTVARPRRASHARHEDQRVGASVRHRRLRGRPREQRDRHGRGRADRPRAPPEAAARRLVGISPSARFRSLPRDRR